MGVRVVLLDIGGVLEHTPPTGWMQEWERRLDLAPGGIEHRIMSLLDVDPHDVVFVDDREVCVAAASDLGMHAIQFTDNATTITAIEALLGRDVVAGG